MFYLYLTAESTDKLRVIAQKEKGIILEFADGEIIKQPLYFETYNLAFTYATIEELYDENYKVLAENKEKGIPVFVVTMKTPRPQITNIEVIAA